MLAALGMTTAEMEGRSLALAKDAAYPSVNTLYGDPTLRAVRIPNREGAEKLIHNTQRSDAYDLDSDPNEHQPLPATAELLEVVPDEHQQEEVTGADTREALKSPGYLD